MKAQSKEKVKGGVDVRPHHVKPGPRCHRPRCPRSATALASKQEPPLGLHQVLGGKPCIRLADKGTSLVGLPSVNAAPAALLCFVQETLMTKQSKFGSRCELSEKFLTEEGRTAKGAGESK